MQKQNRNQKAKRYRTEKPSQDNIPVYVFRDEYKQSKHLMPYIRAGTPAAGKEDSTSCRN